MQANVFGLKQNGYVRVAHDATFSMAASVFNIDGVD